MEESFTLAEIADMAEAADQRDVIFFKKRYDAGVRAVCKAMDDLGLTLYERWLLLRVLERSAFALMDDNFKELAGETS